MEHELVIQDKRHAALEATPMLTPMQELQARIIREGDLGAMKELMALQERWEAATAKTEFLSAFAAFKAEGVRIVKNVTIKSGPLVGMKHADLFGIVNVVTPALSAHGLTLSWQLTKDEPQWMEITCTLRHERGHSESVSMGGAPDTGPGRNAIQARGSAKTYLERYTALAILGMAAANTDDDGNGAVRPSEAEQGHMEEGDALDLLASIEGSGDKDELQKNYNAALDAAMAVGDKTAISKFSTAKNNRLIQLKGGR